MTLPDLRKLTQLTRMPGRQLIFSALLGRPKRASVRSLFHAGEMRIGGILTAPNAIDTRIVRIIAVPSVA